MSLHKTKHAQESVDLATTDGPASYAQLLQNDPLFVGPFGLENGLPAVPSHVVHPHATI